MKKVLLGVCLLLAVFSATSVLADGAKSKLSDKMKVSKEARIEKINSAVQDVFTKIRADRDKARNPDDFSRTFDGKKYSNPLVHVNDDGYIQVYIHLNAINSSALNELERNSVIVEIVNEKYKIVQGWIPFDSIEIISALPFVIRVNPPDYGVEHSGLYTTEGAAILLSDTMNEIEFDGSGAKVGVISDGVNNFSDAASTDDLPLDVTVFGSCISGICNEGTAMLEIIHDIAPGAQLAFGATGGTSLGFISRLDDLSDTFGANIIVDDVGYFGEPYFEDGNVAKAVKEKVDNGVLYVSSAGNEANKHYQGNFAGVIYFDPAIPNHDFGSSAGGTTDSSMNIELAGGENVTVRLQWNDAFGTSSNDYDLYLINYAETAILARSETFQNGTNDPYESLTYTNPLASSIIVKIAIMKYSGANRLLEMFVLGGTMLEYVVPESSIFGHPAIPGVVSVAAIDANDPDNNDIESYSSRGPVEIFYPTEETREKPDLTGIDGVEVSGAGGFSSPFSGTSAAAPHVAGLAALLYGPFSTSAQEIITALKDSAVDLGSAGFDSTFGSGRANVYEAAKLLNKAPTAVISKPTDAVTIVKGDKVEFLGTCADVNGGQNTYLWNFGAGSGIADQSVESPGNITFNQAGTFKVSFNCTDVFGVSQSSPSSRTITVSNVTPSESESPSNTGGGSGSDNSGGSGSSDSGGSGGGGCSILYVSDAGVVDSKITFFLMTIIVTMLAYMLVRQKIKALNNLKY